MLIPSIDLMNGKDWSAFAPPARCPVHHTLIKIDESYHVTWFGPQRQRDCARIAKTEFPYAAITFVEPDEAYVCSQCRASAEVWASR